MKQTDPGPQLADRLGERQPERPFMAALQRARVGHQAPHPCFSFAAALLLSFISCFSDTPGFLDAGCGASSGGAGCSLPMCFRLPRKQGNCELCNTSL